MDMIENLYPDKITNYTDLKENTYDHTLLEGLYNSVSGNLHCINHTWEHSNFNSTWVQESYTELTKFTKSKNLNRRAIKYYLYTQSLLVNEIESPFGKEIPELSKLNFDFQYYEDTEIQKNEKLNYLALMEFWKEYVWVYHQNSPPELIKIHDEYMRLLVMLFPERSKKKENLKPFEWMNHNCKCTVDKAAIFLNPAKMAHDYYISRKGVLPLQPSISDNTELDLSYDHYYPKGEIEKAKIQISQEGIIANGVPHGANEVPHGANGVPHGANEVPHGVNGAPNNPGEAGPQPAEQLGNQNPNGNMNGENLGNGINPAEGVPNRGNGFLGGWNPLRFLSNTRYFGNLFAPNKPPVESDPDLDEPVQMRLLKEDALKHNESGLYLNIANLYMVGHTDIGLLQNEEKAWKYYKVAADLDNPIAIHNIAVKEKQNNQSYSLELFQRWAKLNFPHWYIGLGLLYKSPNFQQNNISLAIEFFETALSLNENEGAIYLAEIYLNYEDFKNVTKGLKYLDDAIENTDTPFAKLMLIAKYLEDQTLFEKFVTCKRVYKLMKSLQKVSEINNWYYFGYQKYTIGKIDQALQIFSFAALNGHKDAALAAAYIWEHDMTQSLTWKFGHYSLCAFIYNMQSFFLKDEEAGVRAARSLIQLKNIIF